MKGINPFTAYKSALVLLLPLPNRRTRGPGGRSREVPWPTCRTRCRHSLAAPLPPIRSRLRPRECAFCVFVIFRWSFGRGQLTSLKFPRFDGQRFWAVCAEISTLVRCNFAILFGSLRFSFSVCQLGLERVTLANCKLGVLLGSLQASFDIFQLRLENVTLTCRKVSILLGLLGPSFDLLQLGL